MPLARTLIAFVAAAGLNACRPHAPEQPVPAGSLPARIAGCWRVLDTAGYPRDGMYNASAAVRLDTTIAEAVSRGLTPRFLAKLDSAGRELSPDGRRSNVHWGVDTLTDSVRVSFSTGHSGAVLTLDHATLPDTLRGRAEVFWDMGPSVEDAVTVMLVRMPCPTPS
ncbi:MAG TPA: hypothetical protein VF665_06440 [Longimicrobium sp.]|jgi:hypothetical protein|uniref:hypothetical protein n=1 Tax=Longimicrobium sp. TaxID=2029185 RepID=UPI002ED771F8